MWRRAVSLLRQRAPPVALGASVTAAAGAAALLAGTPGRETRCDIPTVNQLGAKGAAELQKKFPNFRLIPQTEQNKAIMTILRDENTKPADFVFFSDRIIRTLVEDALEEMPHETKVVKTPTGVYTNGVGWKVKLEDGAICGVSIVRAGESMEAGVRQVLRGIKIGKILIQRDEETALPKLFYSKFPPNISQQMVLLLDPMLATGGSAIAAIDVLVEKGVPPERIIFINLVTCPEGVAAMAKAYPKVRIVSAALDAYLDARKYIVPGLGDFGDRYFGTT